MEGYLDGVQSGALADLVGDCPEGQTAGIGQVGADTSHIYGVRTCRVEGLGVTQSLAAVDQNYAGSCLKGGAGFTDGDGTLCLDPYSLAVGAHDGDADAGGADLE